MTFDGLSYEHYIENDFGVREMNLVDDIFHLSRPNSKPSSTLIEDEKLTMIIRDIQPVELCHGHDVCAVLKCWYNGLRKNPNIHVNQPKVWSFLLNCYDYEDFQRTKLFSLLKKWQNENPPFCLLSIR